MPENVVRRTRAGRARGGPSEESSVGTAVRHTAGNRSRRRDMAVFSDEAEVYEYLGGVFRHGLTDEALVAQLQPSGVVLRIHYTDPDAVLTVDMPGAAVHTGAGNGPDPNVELYMTADTGNRFWQGLIVLPVALAKGEVRAKGPVAKLLKLLPLAKSLFEPYRRRLETSGRTDLLAT
jgi:hypothetical protein